jgi:nucleoside-diphosphate-sugar epimerase
VHEQDEPRPTDQYGRSKLAAEQTIRAAGLPFAIFRPVVIYGPNPKGNMQMVVRLARSSVPLPVRAFASRRSMLAVENLISAIIFVLKSQATIGETYLVADAKPMTIGGILTMLRKMQGRAMSTIFIRKLSFGSC